MIIDALKLLKKPETTQTPENNSWNNFLQLIKLIKERNSGNNIPAFLANNKRYDQTTGNNNTKIREIFTEVSTGPLAEVGTFIEAIKQQNFSAFQDLVVEGFGITGANISEVSEMIHDSIIVADEIPPLNQNEIQQLITLLSERPSINSHYDMKSLYDEFIKEINAIAWNRVLDVPILTFIQGVKVAKLVVKFDEEKDLVIVCLDLSDKNKSKTLNILEFPHTPAIEGDLSFSQSSDQEIAKAINDALTSLENEIAQTKNN